MVNNQDAAITGLTKSSTDPEIGAPVFGNQHIDSINQNIHNHVDRIAVLETQIKEMQKKKFIEINWITGIIATLFLSLLMP